MSTITMQKFVKSTPYALFTAAIKFFQSSGNFQSFSIFNQTFSNIAQN